MTRIIKDISEYKSSCGKEGYIVEEEGCGCCERELTNQVVTKRMVNEYMKSLNTKMNDAIEYYKSRWDELPDIDFLPEPNTICRWCDSPAFCEDCVGKDPDGDD